MKVLIIGGGACGASAAARLRRLDDSAEIIILEKTFEISIANCGLPYYCSGYIADENIMHVSSPKKFKELLNVDVKLGAEVVKIKRDEKKVVLQNGDELPYDKLVLAPGANPFVPDIEGVCNNPKIFTVRMLKDIEKIKEFIKNTKAKNAVIIGGGFIGIEMAESLSGITSVTLIELREHVLPHIDYEIAAAAQNEIRKHGVKLILSDGVKNFGDNELLLESGRKIPYDIAIIGIGVKPETTLAASCGLKIGKSGAVMVNEFMQTSDENIYAGGDSVEVNDFVSGNEAIIPMAGPANRQGRIIADNIKGYKSTYKKTIGASVIKVFDLTVASVGMSEASLKKSGIEYLKTITFGFSHASYYPNATRTLFKMLFNREGDILGMQAVGREGVDKRVDVMAAAMRNHNKVWDLIDLELCYAPPYSSAKDPVNILGMNADNILKGFFKPAFYEDIEGAMLVDVRNFETFNRETIDGAKHIYTPDLREKYNGLPRNKKIILFCNTGFQSYVASRILIQRGFENVYSLCAGIELYKILKKNEESEKIALTV